MRPGYGLVVNVCVMSLNVFKSARCYYKFYEGHAQEEQRELGEYWKSLGAPKSETEGHYFPEERRAVADFLTLHEDTRRKNDHVLSALCH